MMLWLTLPEAEAITVTQMFLDWGLLIPSLGKFQSGCLVSVLIMRVVIFFSIKFVNLNWFQLAGTGYSWFIHGPPDRYKNLNDPISDIFSCLNDRVRVLSAKTHHWELGHPYCV